MSVPQRIEIYKKNCPAGFLSRTDSGSEFRYHDAYFLDPTKPGLSVHLNKQEPVYRTIGDNLHAYFAGLLPEGRRLKALVSNVKTSEDDLFSLFAAAGSSAIGDVWAQGIGEHSAEIKQLKQVDFYELFSTYCQGIGKLKEDVALAGVQEKISASMISFPLRTAKKNKKYILKLNPKDKPNLIENEWAFMQLAQKCGLETAAVKLVQDKQNNLGLLVERFDHFYQQDQWQYLHMEDICQLMNKYPQDKYNVSFKEVCQAISQYCPAGSLQVTQALLIYVFSYLIGNGDLHAKNLSLIERADTGELVLSPAYDLLTTYIYKDDSMALKIDGRDKNIKRETFVSFARRFNISSTFFNRKIELMLKRFEQSIEKTLKAIPLDHKQETQLRFCISQRLKHLSE